MRHYNWHDWKNGVRVKLDHREIKADATAADGSKILNKNASPADKLELYVGGAYDDYLQTKIGGRTGGQYWVVPDKGWLYVRGIFRTIFPSAIRVTYRFGGSAAVPGDITRAATMLAAVKALEADRSYVALPDSGEGASLSVEQLRAGWERQAHEIIVRRTEVMGVHA